MSSQPAFEPAYRDPHLVVADEPRRDGDPARARIKALSDARSFNEFGSAARHRGTPFGSIARPEGDGVVAGTTRIDGRQVGIFAQDSAALGGSLGEVHAAKIARVLDHAARSRIPVVALLDSAGARIHEGVAALDGCGGIFRRNVQLSGRVPQISVVLGACAGGAAYSPALTNIVIMTRRSQLFLTGPNVVRAVTAENVTADELGGSTVHAARSGLAHLVASGAQEALDLTRRVLSYLPDSCEVPAPTTGAVGPEPMPTIPDNHRKPYDVRTVIRGIVDSDSVLELQEQFAPNIVTTLARLHGEPVGVVANQPHCLAGTLDINASEKAARFVRLCDAFGLPILTLVDTPGFLPGTSQEHNGVIRKGAKLLFAYSEATVPRVTVVLRKAFGGAYVVMNSRSLGADAVYAWPSAELAVMGAEGAIDIVYRRDLEHEPERRAEFLAAYRERAMLPQIAAERMSVDEIIAPEETRHVVATAFRALRGAGAPRYRHDNLPQ